VYQLLTVNELHVQYGRVPLNVQVANITGIMEMGGASMQAAFKPLSSILLNEFEVTLGSSAPFGVYADSWMGFGLNSAMDRSCQMLLRRNITENPCFLKGPVYPVTLYKATKHEISVNFTGSSNATECSKLVRSLLHGDYECLQEPCSIMGSYFPAPAGTFVGISAFYYTLNGLGLIGWNEVKEVPLTDILARSKALCGLSAEQAMATPPFNSTSWKYTTKNCFAGFFVAGIVKAFRLSEPGSRLIYQRKMYGEDFSWTRGAVLYEIDTLPEKRRLSYK